MNAKPMPGFEILYEDNHLLVVNKPAGIATMGAEVQPTVYTLAAEYIKRKYDKPGKAFIGIVSRLDTMTSGVLVLARTSKAARRLNDQFAAKAQNVRKVYLVVVTPPLPCESDLWSDWVCKDDEARRMRLVKQRADAKAAELRFQTIGSDDNHSIVAVELLTGRKHQIRVQFADRGHPVLGDRKYGCAQRFGRGIALHSWRLRLVHPTRREPMWFAATPPASWQSFRRWIAPDDAVWDQIQTEFGMESEV